MISATLCFRSHAGWPSRTGALIDIYDTGDHQIFGVAQSQSTDQTLTFTSQTGLVRIADLPKVRS